MTQKNEDLKKYYLSIYMTAEEKLAIKQIASDYGFVNMSRFIRSTPQILNGSRYGEPPLSFVAVAIKDKLSYSATKIKPEKRTSRIGFWSNKKELHNLRETARFFNMSLDDFICKLPYFLKQINAIQP